jgi:Polysulphide reductase, NrfD
MTEDDEAPILRDAQDAPPEVSPAEEAPRTSAGRETEWVADHSHETRDMRPAVGTPGAPGSWERAVEGAGVPLARPDFGDARWSYLFKDDTAYASERPADGEVQEAGRRGRGGPVADEEVHGPIIKAPVWTWEVPLYSGSAFVALACDVARDRQSARTARLVALAAVSPAPLLLIADLGRPGRFLNMLRIFKPRSPMNLGAWCLVAFSATSAGGVAADLLRFEAAARGMGAATAALGGYLGSYTGVLLASTAVPVWSRSRSFLGPIFMATATATGAALTRLVLVGRGLPEGHPTRVALGRVESGAMGIELVLSTINERRLGPAGRARRQGRPRTLFRVAEGSVLTGLALRLAGERVHAVSSVLYLAGGLAFRYAWVEAGRASARDDVAVARTARGHAAPAERRQASRWRDPRGAAPGRVWTETVRRTSLLAERLLPLPKGG